MSKPEAKQEKRLRRYANKVACLEGEWWGWTDRSSVRSILQTLEHGSDPGKKWPGKGEGKEKSAGVAPATKGQAGGLTYVELSYAPPNQLPLAGVAKSPQAVDVHGE